MKNHIQLEITSIEEASTNISVTLHKKNEKEMHEFINESKVLKLFILKENYNTKLDYELLGGSIVEEVLKYGNEITLNLKDFQNDEGAYIINGFYLRSWVFDEFKKKNKIQSLRCLVKDHKEVENIFENHLKKTSDGVLFARRMCELPPNVLTPKVMAEEIKNLFLQEKDVKVTLLDKHSIKEKNMNLLYGVGMGSIHEPYVVIVEKGTNPTTVLLGKGVTFDTGGISLKPSDSMIEMKKDMAGAASVIGAVYASKEPVIAIVGLVENMIGSKAQRVSDIWKSMSGDTVEILNTDAEGRLVLADLMTLAQTYSGIKEIIDLATLTGAVGVALGKEYGAVMSNDNNLANKLMDSGREVGDLLWQLPCGDEYSHHLKCENADLKNVGTKGESGTIAGAKFIEFFLKDKSIAWAHLDIASVISKKSSLCHEHTNGFGVRLLEHYLENKNYNSCCNKKNSCCN
jgi:leucyl aminopeptidase